MRDNCVGNDRSQELGAFFESKGFEATADSVEEDVTCGLILDMVSVCMWKVNVRGHHQRPSRNLSYNYVHSSQCL